MIAWEGGGGGNHKRYFKYDFPGMSYVACLHIEFEYFCDIHLKLLEKKKARKNLFVQECAFTYCKVPEGKCRQIWDPASNLIQDYHLRVWVLKEWIIMFLFWLSICQRQFPPELICFIFCYFHCLQIPHHPIPCWDYSPKVMCFSLGGLSNK